MSGSKLNLKPKLVVFVLCVLAILFFFSQTWIFIFLSLDVKEESPVHQLLHSNRTIELIIVVLDQTTSRRVPQLIKNIFGRPPQETNTLGYHLWLHIVCNLSECYNLGELFRSWRVDSLTTFFYDITLIPNFSILYSSNDRGLIKHWLPEILPSNVNQVILLDPNVVVLVSITDLWNMTSKLSPSTTAPIYESAVAIMDLGKMREAAWSQQLLTFLKVEKHPVGGVTEAAFLAYASKKNELAVSELDCVWDIQLGRASVPSSCIREGVPFLELEEIVVRDGNLLRTHVKPQAPAYFFSCFDARQEERIRRRIHPFYYGTYVANSSRSNDITLVCQGSVDRLRILEKIVSRWRGPISLAIYLHDEEILELEKIIAASPLLANNGRLGIHLVFKEGNHYPTNTLRNVAMDYALTSHVFTFDVDFVPSVGIYETLMSVLKHNPDIENTAFVVPAFETFDRNLDFPKQKSELISHIKTEKVVPARIRTWRFGHRATDFDRWFQTSDPYQVKWAPDFEPYVLVPRDAGRFDVRFVGFGWDKVAFFMLLAAKEFKFVVLPEPFVVHAPHPKTKDDHLFHSSLFFRRCIDFLKHEYVLEIARRYGRKWIFYPRIH